MGPAWWSVFGRLSAKSAAFGDLGIDHGEDWIAVFAASLPDENGVAETILPALEGIALYEEAAGWWLPIGVEIAAPVLARASLRAALGGKADLPVVYPGGVRPKHPPRCPSSLAVKLAKLLPQDFARAGFGRRSVQQQKTKSHDLENNVQQNEVEES